MTSTARSTPSPTSSAPAERTAATSRETFASRLGGLLTIVGVSVGLGHVWRFPYMVGKFGGAAFVLFYVLVSVVIGVPALMAEFALGRSHAARTRGRVRARRPSIWALCRVVPLFRGYSGHRLLLGRHRLGALVHGGPDRDARPASF